MGQWRLGFYFKLQIGLRISFEYKESVILDIPFIRVTLGLMDCASGVRFF